MSGIKVVVKVGAPGKSAYRAAVDAGFLGTESEWLASLKGPPGVTISATEPPLETGDQALWLKFGLGPDGDQFGLFLVTGD